MIKRFLLLLVSSILVVPGLYADNAPSASETREIPVLIRKQKDDGGPNKHMPSSYIQGRISIADERIWFELPNLDYPMQVEIEMETEPYGYWTATLSDKQSTLEGFDGFHGDYRLTLATADGSSYIGYFSL